MQRSVDFGMQQCDSMLKNKELMATLRDAAFDVVLLDPMVMCGDLVADVLSLPLIISLRFSFGGVLERHCGHALAPPSYVPAAPLPYGDRMTFVERLISTVTYVWMSAMTEVFWRLTLDQYYSEVKGQRVKNRVSQHKMLFTVKDVVSVTHLRRYKQNYHPHNTNQLFTLTTSLY